MCGSAEQIREAKEIAVAMTCSVRTVRKSHWRKEMIRTMALTSHGILLFQQLFLNLYQFGLNLYGLLHQFIHSQL